MQNNPAENRRALSRNEPAPDLTDFMNDWFFGAMNAGCGNAYDLTGTKSDKEKEYHDDDDEDGFLAARNSTSSRQAQEWLEEAKRIVAMSPGRVGSPSRLVGSPRFASERTRVPSAILDRRDPLSRSARRHRSVENFSGEILSKTAEHSCNKSGSFESQQQQQRQRQITEKSSAASVQQWFSNILKLEPKQNQEDMSDELNSVPKPPAQKLHPPRQPVRRMSRFQDEVPNSQIAAKSIPTRAFQATSVELENPVLSPPKHLIESAHRRSISSSTCSLDRPSRLNAEVVKVGPKIEPGQSKEDAGVGRLNLFLRKKKSIIEKISKGEVSTKAKIILSSSDNSTSSMVAAICYAWLFENKKEDESWDVVVPVMNLKRERMWKQRQAAWLFHHVGIDATALLFSDEVDLESLILGSRLSILVVGQDILKTNGEVGSQCTVLTDNYCEDAYELLQMPYMKNLLLAGILLDTQNLSTTAKISKNKDAEAVQLLLVGSATNQRLAFYCQLTKDQRDNKFLHALTNNYGKPSYESDDENEASRDYIVSGRKSTSNTQQINLKTPSTPSDTKITIKQAVSTKSGEKKLSATTAAMPIQIQAIEPASRGKGKFSFVRWLGFGSKQ